MPGRVGTFRVSVGGGVDVALLTAEIPRKPGVPLGCGCLWCRAGTKAFGSTGQGEAMSGNGSSGQDRGP
jgi:hypothetical protein